MKLLISLFTLILLPQLSFASHSESLKAVIDDYHYAYTVEWDQQDEAFMQRHEEVLLESITHLLEAGLEVQDVVEAFPKIDVKKLERDLKKENLNTSAQIREFVRNAQNSYDTGSSWAPSNNTLVYGIVTVIGIMIIIRIISAGKKSKECRASGGNWSLEGYCWYAND